MGASVSSNVVTIRGMLCSDSLFPRSFADTVKLKLVLEARLVIV